MVAVAKTKQAAQIQPMSDYLVNAVKGFKTLKVAVPDDLRRKDRSSALNDSPLLAEIDTLLKVVAQHGGFKPYEMGVIIDTGDTNDPVIRDLSKKVKNLKSSLLTNLRHKAKMHGLPISCIKNRQGKKIFIGGEEL